MVRPADFPVYATNTNYTTGPHNGTATKIAMVAGDTQNGNIKGIAPNARKHNWFYNLVGLWIAQLAAELDILNAATSSQPYVIWRPSEPSPAGNIYASFTAAVAAAVALPYPRVDLIIDTSLASTIAMPTSTVNLSNKVWLVAVTPVTLQFGANAVLQNPGGFDAQAVTVAQVGMTLQLTSATGGAAIQSSTSMLTFSNVKFEPNAFVRTMLSSTSGNFDFVNCRLSGTFAFTGSARVSISGPRASINGNTVMTASSILSIYTDTDDATWAPGYTGDRGNAVFPTVVMLQAFITGTLQFKGSTSRGTVTIDGGDSAGLVTLTQDLDLGSRFDLRVVETVTLDTGAFLISGPYRSVNLGAANVTTSGSAIFNSQASVSRRSLTIEGMGATFSRSGGSGEYRLVVLEHNTFSKLRFIGISQVDSNGKFFRITTTMAASSPSLSVEFHGSIKLVPGGFWSRQSSANVVNLSVVYNSSYQYIAESYYNAWDLAGTFAMIDVFSRRLPKAFPVKSFTFVNDIPLYDDTTDSSAATTSITFVPPVGTFAGDMAIIIATTADQAATATGYTQLLSSSNTGLTRLTVLYRILTGTDSFVLNDSGDHQIAELLIVKAGTFNAASPFGGTSTGNAASASSHAVTGVTTSNERCLVITAISGDEDASSVDYYSTITQASSGYGNQVLLNRCNTSGNGGSLAISASYKMEDGATGTVTFSGASPHAAAWGTFAIRPPAVAANYAEWDLRKLWPDIPDGDYVFELTVTWPSVYSGEHITLQLDATVTSGVASNVNSWTATDGITSITHPIRDAPIIGADYTLSPAVSGGNLACYVRYLDGARAPSSPMGMTLTCIGSSVDGL